jgi:hypothetical protein
LRPPPFMLRSVGEAVAAGFVVKKDRVSDA